MTEAQVLRAMESVKETTAWTIVMNQKKLTYDLYFRGDFSTPYSFSLLADSQ